MFMQIMQTHSPGTSTSAGALHHWGYQCHDCEQRARPHLLLLLLLVPRTPPLCDHMADRLRSHAPLDRPPDAKPLFRPPGHPRPPLATPSQRQFSPTELTLSSPPRSPIPSSVSLRSLDGFHAPPVPYGPTPPSCRYMVRSDSPIDHVYRDLINALNPHGD